MGSGLSRSMPASRSSSARFSWDLALAVGRIALGAYWLWEQHWKLPPEFGIHDARGLMFSFQSSIDAPNTLGLYRSFLQNIVVPNFFVFGWLVFLTESTIGLSLTFGVFTKAGALLGTLQSMNLLVAQGATAEGPWLYLGIIAANLAALLTPSNRRLSFDGALARKLPASNGVWVRLVRWIITP